MPFTRLELEQVRGANLYNDAMVMGPHSESGVTHEEDFNYLISQIKIITGKPNWYDTPIASLEELQSQIDALVVASGVVGSWTEVFNNGHGILDADTYDPDIRLGTGRTLRIANENGSVDFLEVNSTASLIRNLGRREFVEILSNVPANIEILMPNGSQYTLGDVKFRNLEVYRNGVLMLPGSGNDYIESSASGVKFAFPLKKKDIIQFRING